MATILQTDPTVLMKTPEVKGCSRSWREGWYEEAQTLPSPNFGPRPSNAEIDLVVVHSISLPPGQFGTNNVQRLFTNQLDWGEHPYFLGIKGLKVSSHFFVTRLGALWQFVSCNERAWHAGESTYRCRSNCNDDSIGIELEGLEGGTFEAIQYKILIVLIQDLMVRYPIKHIAGHEHIAPGRKFDPGPGFDWQRLERQIAAPASYFPRSW